MVATIKNKDCTNDFYEAGLPCSPGFVITRWVTSLGAALYYSEYFPAVRTIVNDWTGDGPSVSRAKKSINVDNLGPDLVYRN